MRHLLYSELSSESIEGQREKLRREVKNENIANTIAAGMEKMRSMILEEDEVKRIQAEMDGDLKWRSWKSPPNV